MTQSNVTYPARLKNLDIYRVSAFDAYLNLKHAVFTRKGGFSQAPYHSLNLSVSVGDSPGTVSENFLLACKAVGVNPTQTVSCHLVHGADILTIDNTNQQQVMGKADGLVTKTAGVYLFMRFADCTPLIFFDPVQQAVGLTHAGWRGTMQNAAGATIQAMVEQLGSQAENIIAVIGPSIGPCCYEVGQDVMSAAVKAFDNPEPMFQQNGKPNYAYFDMWAANHRQLNQAGVKQIIQFGLCTACRTDEFFSHRAEKGRTGRFGVIIGLEGQRE